MRDTRRLRLLMGCLLVGLLAIPAQTAAAATATRGPDLYARFGRSAWVGRGVLDPAGGTHQRLAAPIQPGRTRDVLIAVSNPGPSATFLVTAAPATSGFTVAYVDGHHQEVTGQVTGAGDRVQIDARSRVFFHLEVSAAVGLDTGANVALWIGAQGIRSEITDLVRVVVTVGPVAVAALSRGGTLKCSATFPTRSLDAGARTAVTARLTNVSGHTITTYADWVFLKIRAPDGSLLYRTGPVGFLGIPPPVRHTLAPGHSAQLLVWNTTLRWSGPLHVQAICSHVAAPMNPVTIDVTSPGPPASVSAAIDAAVAFPGSPFQDCPPGPAGEPSTGVIAAPDGRHVPSLTVRCWATVTAEAGFDVVNLYMVSPDDAPAYVLSAPFDINPQPARDAPNYLAASWSFVVTSAYARPFVALSRSKALGRGQGVYSYALRHGVWHSDGWSMCDVQSFTFVPYGNEFPLDLITGCHGSSASPSHVMVRRVLLGRR